MAPTQSSHLEQDPSHISLSVFSVELAQQELCREPLCHKVGHAVAIIAIEDPIQEAVVFTSSRGSGKGRAETGGMQVVEEVGKELGRD